MASSIRKMLNCISLLSQGRSVPTYNILLRLVHQKMKKEYGSEGKDIIACMCPSIISFFNLQAKHSQLPYLDNQMCHIRWADHFCLVCYKLYAHSL